MIKASAAVDHSITRWLNSNHPVWLTLYVSLSAFCLYSCVYAFRKAFSVATFEGIYFAGITYKVWLVTAQVVGYAASKFIGIKVISELKADARVPGILLMVGIAGVSWLLFALTPAPYNIVFLLTNGLPLGMVWGMIFSYLEGRRVTEVLGASLAVSFIFSSGLCRSVGSFVIKYWNTSEFWMPFVTACIFALPLFLFLFLLSKTPNPSQSDEELRTKRTPMNKAERMQFVKDFLPGIILLVLTYILLTAYRDFRDNFSAEIWKALSLSNDPSIYTRTEIPVSIAVLILMSSLMIIKNNKRALMINHVIIAAGMLVLGLSNYLFELKLISEIWWMTLIGVGLYMGYIPFNSILFDRLIATFRYTGTVGFIMYVADSFGYLGSVGVLIYKEFGHRGTSWLYFFLAGGYIISSLAFFLIIGSMWYMHQKHTRWSSVSDDNFNHRLTSSLNRPVQK